GRKSAVVAPVKPSPAAVHCPLEHVPWNMLDQLLARNLRSGLLQCRFAMLVAAESSPALPKLAFMPKYRMRRTLRQSANVYWQTVPLQVSSVTPLTLQSAAVVHVRAASGVTVMLRTSPTVVSTTQVDETVPLQVVDENLVVVPLPLAA